MLLAEHHVLALERLQAPDLAGAPPLDDAPPGSAPEEPVARFLPPARQHEGVDVQRVGDRLDLHPEHATELHRRQLELDAVVVNLPRTDRSPHPDTSRVS